MAPSVDCRNMVSILINRTLYVDCDYTSELEKAFWMVEYNRENY